MRRGVLPILLLCLAPAIAAAPAQAARQLAAHAETDALATKISPPAIVGGQVAWMEVTQFDFTRATVSAVPLSGSGRKTTLARFTRAQPNAELGVRFDAEDGRVGYSQYQGENRPAPPDRSLFNTISTGAPGAAPTEIDRCDATDAMPLVANGRTISVGANAVAFTGLGCDRNGITVRSLTAGYTRRLDGSPVLFDLSGDLIAYSTNGGGDAVYNHASDQIVYSTSGRLPGGKVAFSNSLQPDGKLAQTDSTRLQSRKICNVTVAIFTPAEPAGRLYPMTSCGADVVLSGDRVTMMRDAGGGSAELVNADLNGGDVKVLARFANPNLMLGLDAEGSQVVWHAYECGSKPLYLGDGTVAPPTAATCPLKAPKEVTVDKRKRSVTVPVACTRGCQSVGLTLNLGGGVMVNTTSRASIRKGTKKIKLPLTAAARKRIGRRDFNARLTVSYVPTTLEESRRISRVRVDVP